MNRFRTIRTSVHGVDYPDDSRTLNQRIRQMLFKGVPLGENPDVRHDFEKSDDRPGDMSVNFDYDIHNDVFDKLEHAQYISLSQSKSVESPTPSESPTPPTPPPGGDEDNK